MATRTKTEKRRAAVAILYAGGKTHAQIAYLLGVSESTIRNDIHHLHQAVSGFDDYAQEQLFKLRAQIDLAIRNKDSRSVAALSAVARRWFPRDGKDHSDQPIVWELYDHDPGTH